MSAADDYAAAMSAQRAKYGDPKQYLNTKNATAVAPTPDMANKSNPSPMAPSSSLYEALASHADRVHPVKP